MNWCISDAEKKLLAKGLNFCLTTKQFNYADYYVHFELFNRNICNLEVLSEDEDFVKTRNSIIFILTAPTILSKNKYILIQKSDKGKSVVIVDKETVLTL